MAIRLRRTGLALQPKVVFLCCHWNDIADATVAYHSDELNRYLAAGAADPYEPAARLDFWPRRRRRFEPRAWDVHLAPLLYLSVCLPVYSKPGATARSTTATLRPLPRNDR